MTRAPASGQGWGFTAALAASAVLASTAVLIRHLSLAYHLPALVLAFWRDVFVVCTLLPLLGAFRRDLLRVPRPVLPYLAAYGLVLAVFNVLRTWPRVRSTPQPWVPSKDHFKVDQIISIRRMAGFPDRPAPGTGAGASRTGQHFFSRGLLTHHVHTLIFSSGKRSTRYPFDRKGDKS